MAAKVLGEANVETLSKADAPVKEAQKKSAELRESLSATTEKRGSSAKKAEGVASKLADVQKRLADERNATAVMEVERNVVKADTETMILEESDGKEAMAD